MANIILIKTDEDFIKLEQLAVEIWNEHYINIISREQIGYMLKTLHCKEVMQKQVSENYEYYFIEHNGNKEGYVGFAYNFNESEMFLSKLYLRNSTRGIGLGRAAFEFVKNKAKEKGLKSIKLTVNKQNLQTIEIYKKLGFAVEKAVVNDIGGGFVMDDYIMIKRTLFTDE